MKNPTRNAIILTSVLTVVGFTIGRYTAPAQQEVEIIEIPAPTATSDREVLHAKIDLLVKQLADAKTKNAELDAEIDHLLGEDLSELTIQEETAESKTPAQQSRAPRESWQDRMERLKTENPEEYEKMMARREERTRRRQEFLEERQKSEARRESFFANVNIAYMSPEEQQELAEFVAEYQELRTLFEQRQQGERPDMRKAAELGMRVMAKTDEIRLSLLKATAKEMGFNAEESGEFATTINDVFGATSIMGPGGHSMMRSRRGGRR